MADVKVARFIVFAGEVYEPQGGWRDLVSSHATYAEAYQAAQTKVAEISKCAAAWAHVVDLETAEMPHVTYHPKLSRKPLHPVSKRED